MKNEKILWWLVLKGVPVQTAKTRKIARDWVKSLFNIPRENYNYLGKVIQKGKHTYLVIDFSDTPKR